MLHISLLLTLILFICFPSVCIAGATRGLLLWFNIVLPTLFPFFLITRLILSMGFIPKKITILYPIITGLIAGYPTGALTVNELLKENKISLPTARLLLIACNNASPGFLIGIASAVYPQNKYCIWLCTIAASFTVTLFVFIFAHSKNKTSIFYANNHKKMTPAISDRCHNNFILQLESTIISCAKTLVVIGGYIIIFSILSDFLAKLISDSDTLCKGLLTGICEITTGVSLICESSPKNQLINISATAFLCGFGGICALMQTAGATESSGLSMKNYLFHKLLCGAVSVIYVSLYLTYIC